MTHSPSIPVYMNRSQIADRLGLPRPKICMRIINRGVVPDATDAKGSPLYSITRFAEIQAALAIDTQPEPQA